MNCQDTARYVIGSTKGTHGNAAQQRENMKIERPHTIIHAIFGCDLEAAP